MGPHQPHEVSKELENQARSPGTPVDDSPITVDAMAKAGLPDVGKLPGKDGSHDLAISVLAHTSGQELSPRRSASSEHVGLKSPLPQPYPARSLDIDVEHEVEATTKWSRSNSTGSENSAHVDWEGLEKTEEQEPRDDASDEVRRSSQPHVDQHITANRATANHSTVGPARAGEQRSGQRPEVTPEESCSNTITPSINPPAQDAS